MHAEWSLDPAVTYLNHGTVGATPRRVLAEQSRLREEMERQPSRFMLREVAPMAAGRCASPSRMRAAAAQIAAFVGSRAEDLVFVDNATAGANAVLGSLELREGDEVLLSDHLYGAVALAARHAARRARAQITTFSLPYPRFHADAAVANLIGAITPRTRLAVLDHVTSESALVLPLAAMAQACRQRGVTVLADGAHAPGAIPLDVPSLGVDWYTANLHKWAWAPRSSGFLWASRERQEGLHPPVISWGLDQGYTREFDWVGTRDPTPWLAAPAGVQFLHELGLARVQRWNHELAWHAGQWLCDRWRTELGTNEAATGSMITVPLPRRLGGSPEEAARLRDALLFEDGIEVQLHAWGGTLWLRLSAQVYVEMADVERLEAAVRRRG